MLKNKIIRNILIFFGVFFFILIIIPADAPEDLTVEVKNIQQETATKTDNIQDESIEESIATEPTETKEPAKTVAQKSDPIAVTKTVELEKSAAVLYNVVKVVDGDTVKLNINGKTETIRLIGIDTPETVHPSKPVECFGIEASNKAKELLENKTAGLEIDPSQGERDKYGRLLGYIILPDGRNFNKLMVESGYAYEYTYNLPYKYQSEFKQAQKDAENNEIGLWAPGVCNTITNTTAQTQESSVFYLSTYRTSKYYYCESDSAWQNLSEKYLKSYPSKEALLEDYPTQILHEPC